MISFNDEKSNFNPVISADGKSFAFMVTLKFYDAVMFSRLINGKWDAPLISPQNSSPMVIFISHVYRRMANYYSFQKMIISIAISIQVLIMETVWT